jgi:hypothetical protein
MWVENTTNSVQTAYRVEHDDIDRQRKNGRSCVPENIIL